MNTDKCIIFDMDGVLVNSEPLHFDFENRIFKSLGIDVSRKQHETFVGTTSKTMWTIIKETHNLTYTVPELIIKGHSEFLVYLKKQKSIELIPGIYELLNNLEKTRFNIVLASSSPHELINYFLHKCNIDNYFQVKISGDDVNNGKPDPEIFIKASEIAGIRPENCLVIEDSKNGVSAARRAGMKCIGYSNPGSGDQDLSSANLVIRSFNSLSVSVIKTLLTNSQTS